MARPDQAIQSSPHSFPNRSSSESETPRPPGSPFARPRRVAREGVARVRAALANRVRVRGHPQGERRRPIATGHEVAGWSEGFGGSRGGSAMPQGGREAVTTVSKGPSALRSTVRRVAHADPLAPCRSQASRSARGSDGWTPRAHAAGVPGSRGRRAPCHQRSVRADLRRVWLAAIGSLAGVGGSKVAARSLGLQHYAQAPRCGARPRRLGAGAETVAGLRRADDRALSGHPRRGRRSRSVRRWWARPRRRRDRLPRSSKARSGPRRARVPRWRPPVPPPRPGRGSPTG